MSVRCGPCDHTEASGTQQRRPRAGSASLGDTTGHGSCEPAALCPSVDHCELKAAFVFLFPKRGKVSWDVATAPLGYLVGSGSFSLSPLLYGIVVRKRSLSQKPGSFLPCVLPEKPLYSAQAQRPRVTCSSFRISADLSLWPAQCGPRSPCGIPPASHGARPGQ